MKRILLLALSSLLSQMAAQSSNGSNCSRNAFFHRKFLQCVCFAGHEASGGVECRSCPPGHFRGPTTLRLYGPNQTQAQAERCTRCPPNTYMPTPGAASCIPCPPFRVSRRGSRSPGMCDCAPGYWPDPSTRGDTYSTRDVSTRPELLPQGGILIQQGSQSLLGLGMSGLSTALCCADHALQAM
jgi:hypothetical protein